jgi:hypothetical protein
VLNCVKKAPIAEGSKNSETQFNPTSTSGSAVPPYRRSALTSGGYLSQT